mmetsp:Transcript_11005/g.37461  ORF Transcript_11005/g.37461 Transcript_11005/m.37461 type:complete len:356 (+) Transcript_11005:284-1351(+)
MPKRRPPLVPLRSSRRGCVAPGGCPRRCGHAPRGSRRVGEPRGAGAGSDAHPARLALLQEREGALRLRGSQPADGLRVEDAAELHSGALQGETRVAFAARGAVGLRRGRSALRGSRRRQRVHDADAAGAQLLPGQAVRPLALPQLLAHAAGQLKVPARGPALLALPEPRVAVLCNLRSPPGGLSVLECVHGVRTAPGAHVLGVQALHAGVLGAVGLRLAPEALAARKVARPGIRAHLQGGLAPRALEAEGPDLGAQVLARLALVRVEAHALGHALPAGEALHGEGHLEADDEHTLALEAFGALAQRVRLPRGLAPGLVGVAGLPGRVPSGRLVEVVRPGRGEGRHGPPLRGARVP